MRPMLPAGRPPIAPGTALLLLVALLLAQPASARKLVEPGDVLVSTGTAVYVVRGDGGGVEAFTPRAGSGVDRIVAPVGVAVDRVGERVFLANGGEVLLVDPDTGAQTVLTNGLGSPIAILDRASGIDVTADGNLVLVSSEFREPTFPLPLPLPGWYASLFLLPAPTAVGVTGVTTISSDFGYTPVSGDFPVAVSTSSSGSLQIFTSVIGAGGGAFFVNPSTGEVTAASGIPVQAGTFVADVEISCGALVFCFTYWLEARADTGGNCVSGDAAVYANDLFSGTVPIYVGPPLRCPIQLGFAQGGGFVVLDARLVSGNRFEDLRVYRLTRNPTTMLYEATLLAGSGSLPDPLPGTLLPGLDVSPIALPEAGPHAGAAAALLAVVGIGGRRGRGEAWLSRLAPQPGP